MKFENTEKLKNFNKKNVIKIIVFTNEILFNQDFIDIINTYVNLNSLSVKTSNKFDSSLNYLIDELCRSNISKIKIHFKYISWGVWFSKDVKTYDYNKTRMARIWNIFSIHDSKNYYNYDNLPNNINLLRISCGEKLKLINLPINLLKIEINSQYINAIWGMNCWKIPFNCEVCYNNKVIKIN